MLMAATIPASSVLGSPILRRKPTAATCRLQGAPAAPALNLRPCTRSTCLPFRPQPSSGEDSSPGDPGTLTGCSSISGSVSKFWDGTLVAFRPMGQTSNRSSHKYRITNYSVKEKFRGLRKQVIGSHCSVGRGRVGRVSGLRDLVVLGLHTLQSGFSKSWICSLMASGYLWAP